MKAYNTTSYRFLFVVAMPSPESPEKRTTTSSNSLTLKDSGLDNKSVLRCKNMFALGLVCWLFNRNLAAAEKMLREKFAKKPEIAEANIKVLNDGFNYGANTHASVSKAILAAIYAASKQLVGDVAAMTGIGLSPLRP